MQLLASNGCVAPPFVVQLDHDETLSRILLGLSRETWIEGFQTEAEAKRDFRDDRNWRDRKIKVKFPDALLTLRGSMRTIKVAVEVELTSKCQRRYRQIFETYEVRKGIDAVVFIVGSASIFNAVARAMKDAQFPEWKRPIGFSRVDDWQVDPLKAAIHFQDQAVVIEELGVFLEERFLTNDV